MDLYSLHASIDAVLNYLEKIDPDAAKRARLRYSCFDHFSREPQQYGYAATVGAAESCEDAVVEQLVEFRRKAREFLNRDGEVAAEELFFAEQNARLVKNAEQYYRSMFRGRASSWNLRDRHMVETIDALVAHLNGSRQPKAIIWAHNSHLGDARATDDWLRGFNKDIDPKRAPAGFYGMDLYSLHASIDAVLNYLEKIDPDAALSGPRLERAIGVIYRPETERLSHYFHARLPEQFDAIIHIDETRAVEPLERTSVWDEGELPETYPFKV